MKVFSKEKQTVENKIKISILEWNEGRKNIMIFDSIKNKENYRDCQRLYQILCYLDNLTPGELPLPNTALDEEGTFCNPVSFRSKPEKECRYEAHQQYIDLHYIVSGVEGIATADVTGLSVETPYDPKKDIGFYTGRAAGTCWLRKGDFMVCYPSDAHKVAMMEERPEEVRKVVVKIKTADRQGA